MLHKNTTEFKISSRIGQADGFTLSMEPLAIYSWIDEESQETLYGFGSERVKYQEGFVGWVTTVTIIGSGVQVFFLRMDGDNLEPDPSRALPLMEKLIPYAIAGDRESVIAELSAAESDRPFAVQVVRCT